MLFVSTAAKCATDLPHPNRFVSNAATKKDEAYAVQPPQSESVRLWLDDRSVKCTEFAAEYWQTEKMIDSAMIVKRLRTKDRQGPSLMN